MPWWASSRHGLPKGPSLLLRPLEEPQQHVATPHDLWLTVFTSAATRKVTDGELRELLLGVRRRNASRCITGCLAYHDLMFMQVMEGPRATVQRLFATICADARHTGIFVLLDGPTAAREFHDHRMAYVDPTGQPPEGFCEMFHKDWSTKREGTRLRRLLASFADTQLRRSRS